MAKSKRPPPPDIIPAATLLTAYSRGIFPMAEERDDEDVFWLDPERRGILPLNTFRVPSRLARSIRASLFRMTVDTAFAAVMAACADPAPQRAKTWINPLIERSYANLYALGHAHSVEVWDGPDLVGGLYGVSIGAAFFGESMFSRKRDVSKMALVHLVARLKAGGFTLLDTQFVTEHLKQFGAVEIERERYRRLLKDAVDSTANFYVLGGAGAAVCAGTVLQLTTQTS
ncbi:MAG: leucyl/phenylalanyl-tRNA--protein transferase [Alphaproteobacteria bacterium]|nr:leucyl/phenylalanyl-tRNA--protein transferase [Alphaproteobacteria bacterium]